MKWIYIVGGIAYFLYNWYKKNQEREQEKILNNNSEKEENSWGINDPISQFEEKYGVETADVSLENAAVEKVVSNNDYSDYEKEISEEKVRQNDSFSEENVDHHAFDRNQEKKKASNQKNYTIEILQPENEFDLESMVIGSVVLNRPEY